MSTATLSKEDKDTKAPLGGRFVGAASNYIDERTSLSGFVKELGRKIFPDHWSFMLGEIALWSFVVVFLSGTFLTFFFQASMVETHYTGAYAPMRGIEMSAALESSLHISFDLRGGLLVRQIHHWAALVFVAGIGVHMLRVFFTGAFRKPRELNWVIGFVLFILALAEGFTGYSLPDDLLSGNGLRIIDGMVKGLPLIGTWTSFLLFGGEFPGTDIVGRLYSLHILLLPMLVIALIVVHLMLMIINKHTQFAGPGRTNDNVVGYPMMPVYMSKMGGYLFIVFGTIVLIATFFQINPIWNPTTPPPCPPEPSPTGTSASRMARCVWRPRTGTSSSSTTPGRSASSFRSPCSDSSSSPSRSTPSSKRGSPVTSASTTSRSVRATRRPAPPSAWPASSSTPCSGLQPPRTSSRRTSCSRWRVSSTRSRRCCSSGRSSVTS